MFPPGLHVQLQRARDHRERDRRVTQDDEFSPQIQHEAKERGKKLDREIADVELEVAQCESVKVELAKHVRSLSGHTHSSRHLSLAITEMENAFLRIQTHLGEQPVTPL